jgi:hypothetical protein
MAEHASLTGSSLHENKGVATAADNTVATALNGHTVWKKLTSDNFGPGLMPFANNVFLVYDQRPAGTNAGQNVAATWTTAVLNTVATNSITGASLSSNQIILPTGKYWIEAYKMVGAAGAAGDSVGVAKLRLRNITDSTTESVGMSHYYASYASGEISLMDRFEVTSGPKTFALQYYYGTQKSQGLGLATGGSEPEVFARVEIIKLS